MIVLCGGRPFIHRCNNLMHFETLISLFLPIIVKWNYFVHNNVLWLSGYCLVATICGVTCLTPTVNNDLTREHFTFAIFWILLVNDKKDAQETRKVCLFEMSSQMLWFKHFLETECQEFEKVEMKYSHGKLRTKKDLRIFETGGDKKTFIYLFAVLFYIFDRFTNLRKNFSQINTIIDITLPVPRNINAGNKS